MPVIDGQHKKLIGMMNADYNALRKGEDRKQAGEVLDELSRYAAVHLTYEESLLERRGYPELESHVRQHDYYRDQILMLRERHAAGEADVGDLLKFMIGWFKAHIRDADQRYGSFLSPREKVPDTAG
ncbi:MAG: hemerythrin family protein [Deltaproteobacteria bacterium]|nr:hemerythrin family protein [Deltaproteobacteria bacterium]